MNIKMESGAVNRLRTKLMGYEYEIILQFTKQIFTSSHIIHTI